ncbi:MAG: tetratricopeptide repeat protein [Thermoplasmata archaeon]
MASATASNVAPTSGPLDEVRRRYRGVQDAEGGPDRSQYTSALKAFLAVVESHRKELGDAGTELAPWLDETAMSFYRASQPDLARRAVDLGLEFAPGATSLLHHKALILLAQNENLPEVVALTDKALEGNPHDKGLWATRGDALKLLGQPGEAAEAYLRAQQLDASSTQYVDKALKLLPANPRALRMKLELARAQGGELPALAACEELLKATPDDAELLLARADLLVALGRLPEALDALERVHAVAPDDPRAKILHVRALFRLDRKAEAVPMAKGVVAAAALSDSAALEEIARSVEADAPDLAVAARERLREVDPRNLQNLIELRDLGLRLDRVDVALGACRALLAAQPDHLEALRGIAELELAEGHTDAAIEGYRALRAANPHAVGDLRKAMELARSASQNDAVREFAQAILAEEPTDVGGQVELARTLSTGGDVPGALKAYDTLLAAHPGELPYLLEKKEVVARTNDPAQLAPVLDELFRLDPTRTDVAVERGNLYLALAYDRPEGSTERDQAARTALVAYERASTDPDAAGVSELGIARASRLVGDHERAIRGYSAFLDREANHARNDIRKELGHALREAGRTSEATEAYSRAIAGGLEDADLFWGTVEVLAHSNQEARALQLLELLLQREPGNPMYLRKKGQLLLLAGRRPEALTVLQAAVQGTPGDPHAYFEVAEALRAQGAYADAIVYYRRGLEVDPRSRHGRLALAESLLLAGQYPEVVTLADQLLKEDPNELAAWKARGDAWRALGRPSELLYSLTAILLLEPDNAPALLEKCRMHRDAGEKKEAFETLTKLLATHGAEAQDATLHLERGDLAASLGLAEEANHSYERAAEIDPVYRVEIAIRRARLRLSSGRPDLALEVLDEGLKASPAGAPANIAALLLRAEVLSALERPAEARAVYEEVRQREPRSPLAIAGTARSLLDEGRHADALELLRQAIPQVPPQESLFLLLAEALSGLGHPDAASDALKKGVEVLPKSVALWVRWGELGVARQTWAEAANAFAHALSLTPAAVEVLLRAGFVAERMGHPNEALSFYERASDADPANKQAWTSRGLALLATGRPADAQASFDRALAIDSDFGPAKDGKKLATQKTRDVEIQRYGREALLLEAKLNRTIAKNDLFVTLHVPYEFLEPVLATIGKPPDLRLDRIEATEVHDLENASYHLVTQALERRPPGIERRGFTMADVAVLSPPGFTLDQIQRLFGYLKAVLEADLRPENLQLTPDVEELARKALLLPPEQRTLFQLVRNLRVGLYKARLIKVVEEAGSAVHAPLPSLDLGAYSPEFRAEADGGTAPEPPVSGEVYFAPETTAALSPGAPLAPTVAVAAALPRAAPAASAPAAAPPSPGPAAPRCVGCGGLASVLHSCGVPLCQHCIGSFPKCPKCGQPISIDNTRGTVGVAVRATSPASAPTGLRAVFHRSKPAAARAADPSAPRRDHPAPARSAPERRVAPAAPPAGGAAPRKDGAAPPAVKPPPAPTAAPHPMAPKVPEPPAPPSAPVAKPRREKPDDEPRL